MSQLLSQTPPSEPSSLDENKNSDLFLFGTLKKSDGILKNSAILAVAIPNLFWLLPLLLWLSIFTKIFSRIFFDIFLPFSKFFFQRYKKIFLALTKFFWEKFCDAIFWAGNLIFENREKIEKKFLEVWEFLENK